MPAWCNLDTRLIRPHTPPMRSYMCLQSQTRPSLLQQPRPSDDPLSPILLRIVDQIDAMLAYWTPDQVCLFANNAYHSWFGKSRDQLIGTTLQELLGPLYPLNLPFFLAALSGITQVFERDIQLPDGSLRHTIATYTPDLVNNTVRGVIAHVADGTPVKQLAQTPHEARTHEAYRVGEMRFAGIVNAALDAIVSIDADQRVIVFNPAAERLFGCAAAEVLGQPIDRFLPLPQRLAHHNHIVAFQHSGAASRTMHPYGLLLGLRADGSTVPLEASISQVVIDGNSICTAILRDISSRLAAEEALRAAQTMLEQRVAERTRDLSAANAQLAEQAHSLAVSKARYRTLVQNLPGISLLMFDHDLRYLLVEGAALLRHGYDAATMLGRTLEEVAPSERAPVLALAYRAALAGQTVCMEHVVGEYTYETRFVPVYDDRGQVAAGMAVVEDTTERRRAAVEQQRIERAMLEAQRLESLGMLAGGIAHDFNNILMGVQGYLQLLQDLHTPTSATYDACQQALVGIRRATDLTAQMLAYAGQGRIVSRPVLLNEVVNELTKLLSTTITGRARLEIRLDPTLPPVLADTTQIHQIVLNLLTNAVEALETTGGMVVVETGQAVQLPDPLETAIDQRASGVGYLYLEVRDNGVGMDQATQAKIFDPFFSTKAPGRGLGLAAVQGIVRGHGGVLQIHSAPGVGTAVRVYLPVAEGFVSAAVAAPRAAPRPAVTADPARATVLVIDDDSVVRLVLVRMLEQLGYAVQSAPDGVAGLTMLACDSPPIDAALVDLTMPGLSGAALTRAIQQTAPDVRIILMSGYCAEDVAEQLKALGVTNFLQKPFKRSDLAAVLAGLEPSRA